MNEHAALSVSTALIPLQLVNEVICYVDTVVAIFFPVLPRRERKELKKLNDGRLRRQRPRKRKSRFLKPGQVWVLQRPTEEALRYLAKLRGMLPADASDCPFHICRVDIAYDFICHTPHDAETIDACLRQFVRQKWHGKQKTVVFENTQYSRPAGQRRNLAIYADKPSKVTGEPCAHLELRFISVRKCRELGLDNPEALCSGIDPIKLLVHETSIDVPIQQRFERYLDNTARRFKRANRRYADTDVDALADRIARVIAPSLHNEQGCPEPGRVAGARTQDLHDRLKRFRRMLVRVDWEEVIDPPRYVRHRMQGFDCGSG